MTGTCGTHPLALTPSIAKAPAKNTTPTHGVRKLNAMAAKQQLLNGAFAGGGQSGGNAASAAIHTTAAMCPAGFYKMGATINPGAAAALVNASKMAEFTPTTTGGGHKRSRHKRSRHARSRHARSRHKRSRHKRSRHKRSRHKRSRRHISKSSR